MQSVSTLHEMSNPDFWEKCEKNIINLSPTEYAKRVIIVIFASVDNNIPQGDIIYYRPLRNVIFT